MVAETPERYFLILDKPTERFVFVWDASSRGELLKVLASYAGDTGLTLTWHDAGVLSQRIKSWCS